MIAVAPLKNLGSAPKPATPYATPNRMKRRMQPQGSVAKPADDDAIPTRLRRPVQPQRVTTQDGEVLAIRRHEELQDDLQQVFWDCNEVWRHNISYIFPRPRKSWRAAMGHLQSLLTAIFSETLTSTEAKSLSTLSRSKLGRAAAVLWTKTQRQKSTSVFQNHIMHLQEITQATSEEVCWKVILDELLTNETLNEKARRQQAAFLTTQMEDIHTQLRTAIQSTQSFAVLQNQHQPDSDSR
jgi:hypothetical protein